MIGDGILVNQTFAQLYDSVLPPWLLQRCLDLGWIHPTRIQQQALNEIVCEKNDVIIQAETGSGKTLGKRLVVVLA